MGAIHLLINPTFEYCDLVLPYLGLILQNALVLFGQAKNNKEQQQQSTTNPPLPRAHGACVSLIKNLIMAVGFQGSFEVHNKAEKLVASITSRHQNTYSEYLDVEFNAEEILGLMEIISLARPELKEKIENEWATLALEWALQSSDETIVSQSMRWFVLLGKKKKKIEIHFFLTYILLDKRINEPYVTRMGLALFASIISNNSQLQNLLLQHMSSPILEKCKTDSSQRLALKLAGALLNTSFINQYSCGLTIIENLCTLAPFEQTVSSIWENSTNLLQVLFKGLTSQVRF